MVREIACLQQFFLNHENRGFSSAVSIPPVLVVCGNNRAAAVPTQRHSFQETRKGLRASEDSLETGSELT
jgi:hypothetical protein